MINSIMGSGNLQVSGGHASVPYISVGYDEKNPIKGMVRVNGSNLEAFDGVTWLPFSQSYATIALSGVAESSINWVMQQMQKEKEREALIRNNPALQKAYEAIKRAEDNFDIISKFVENDTSHDYAEENMSMSSGSP